MSNVMHRYSEQQIKIGAMTMNLVQRRLFWWREHEIGGVSHFVVLKEWKFSEHGYEFGVMG